MKPFLAQKRRRPELRCALHTTFFPQQARPQTGSLQRGCRVHTWGTSSPGVRGGAGLHGRRRKGDWIFIKIRKDQQSPSPFSAHDFLRFGGGSAVTRHGGLTWG